MAGQIVAHVAARAQEHRMDGDAALHAQRRQHGTARTGRLRTAPGRRAAHQQPGGLSGHGRLMDGGLAPQRSRELGKIIAND